MGLNANSAAGGGSRAPLIEPGGYAARIVQIVDMGKQPHSFKGKDKDPVEKIRITYELVDEFMLDEDGKPDPEKPRWISEEFPFYVPTAERAKCVKRYKVFDPKGDLGYQWDRLIGAPCIVTVVTNKAQDGREFNNVGEVTSPMKGMQIAELVNEPAVFNLDEPDMVVFNKFPDWLKDRITSNVEFAGSKLDHLLKDAPLEDRGEAPSEDTPY